MVKGAGLAVRCISNVVATNRNWSSLPDYKLYSVHASCQNRAIRELYGVSLVSNSGTHASKEFSLTSSRTFGVKRLYGLSNELHKYLQIFN